jgi:hypothetical protein
VARTIIASGIGPPDPQAGRRPPQIRTSAIDASGSSGLWVRYILECTMRAGVSGNTRNMPLKFSQFGGSPQLRRPSHMRHGAVTRMVKILSRPSFSRGFSIVVAQQSAEALLAPDIA